LRALNILELKSRDQAQDALRELKRLNLLLSGAVANRDADLSLLIIEHQVKRAKVDEAHGPLIQTLSIDITQVNARLEVWARENREQEFGEETTLHLDAGVLRFRKGNRALHLMSGWTWKRVVSAMVRARAWKKYLRLRPEPNARLILEDSQAVTTDAQKTKPPKLAAARLRVVGLRVLQEENFQIEFSE
jgi:phage host-nuclease inhibitor protein Gam